MRRLPSKKLEIEIGGLNNQQFLEFREKYAGKITAFAFEKFKEFQGLANPIASAIENENGVKASTIVEWNIAETNVKSEEKGLEKQENSVELPIENVNITIPEKIEVTAKQELDTQQKEEMQQTNNQGYSLSDKEKAFDIQIKNKQITLPNGKVNQGYCSDFDVEKLLPEITEVTFEGLEDVGLKYDKENKQIKGTPNTPGDHKLILKCKRKDWEEGKPIFERQVALIINPDPRSLWKNIATPQDIDYFKPDEAKGFVKVLSKKDGGFLGIGKKEIRRKDIVAASQRGRSHAHEGKARDDDFALNFDETTEWYTIVVADGAGSAQCSRKGSEIACKTVIEVCKRKILELNTDFEKQIKMFHTNTSDANRKLAGDILYKIIGVAAFAAYKEIEKEAQGKGNPVKDYSTTLLLTICKKFEFGWFVGAFWVGDGGIGIYDKEKNYVKILGEPDGGEFAGQTRFLTMPEIMQSEEIYRRLRFDIYDDFTALILMTDGITDPKFETDANLNKIEKWHDLWEDLNGKNEDSVRVDFTDDNEESAAQLLKWLDFWSQGNHDDRTIAILF
ncbi:hypothetical protein FACS1894199_13700 [Bacteroidia bacterium]|nr:hypothetical protein FACS1894199_13700 [Bacteroidia bacterium]